MQFIHDSYLESNYWESTWLKRWYYNFSSKMFFRRKTNERVNERTNYNFVIFVNIKWMFLCYLIDQVLFALKLYMNYCMEYFVFLSKNWLRNNQSTEHFLIKQKHFYNKNRVQLYMTSILLTSNPRSGRLIRPLFNKWVAILPPEKISKPTLKC